MESTNGFNAMPPDDRKKNYEYLARSLARQLWDYDQKPSSDKWAAIQKLAREVLK